MFYPTDLETGTLRKRNTGKTEKIALVGIALAGILAVPLVGSAADVNDDSFGVKSENIHNSDIYTVEGLKDSGSDSGTPTTEPSPEPPAKDDLTQFTINTAQANCDPSTFTLQLPGTASDATIDWGDGSEVTALKSYGNTHNYATAGTYKLKIEGTYGGIRQGDLGNNATKSNSCIQSLDHMGEDTGVTTLTGLFSGTSELAGVAKLPSTVTDLSSMFFRAKDIKADLSKLDVSHVKNFSSMFSQYSGTAIPGISSWNTGSATNMNQMFGQSTTFNQDISSWDVSNVTDFSNMFLSNTAFNQPLNSWDTSSAENMYGMFQAALAFNQPLNGWNGKTGKVTNMSSMFKQARAFDQNLNGWDVSSVSNFGNMFFDARVYNQPMDKWKTDSGTNMYSMFMAASKFDQDISGWGVDKVYANKGYDSFADSSALQTQHKPVLFR